MVSLYYICGPFLLHLRALLLVASTARAHNSKLVQIINFALFGGRYFVLHMINLYPFIPFDDDRYTLSMCMYI